MTKDPFATRREDWGTWLLVPIGLVTVLASFAALAVVGATVADTFVAGADAVEVARDRGVAAATMAAGEPAGNMASSRMFRNLLALA